LAKYPRSVPAIKLNEIFDSVQGEGALVGFRTLFIRFQGCHIGCKWCDTKKSWKETKFKERVYVTALVNLIKDRINKETWICITGGEPFEQMKSLLWISQRLYRYGYRKQSVETAGFMGYDEDGELILPDKKDIIDLFYNDVFMSVSPKLVSALGKRFSYDNLKAIILFWIETYPAYYKFQFKFVISDKMDLVLLSKLKDDIKSLRVHNIFIQIDGYKLHDISFVRMVTRWLKKNECYRMGIQQHKILNMK